MDDQIQVRINQMRALLDSPGWRVLETQLAAKRDHAYNEMLKAEDQFKMAQHMGTFKALKEALEAPEQYISILQAQRDYDAASR